MNTYLGKVTVIAGEYETVCTFRFKTEGDPDKYLDRIAKDWYGSKPEKYLGAYCFDAGCVAVRPNRWKEIPQEQYETLAGFISEIRV